TVSVTLAGGGGAAILIGGPRYTRDRRRLPARVGRGRRYDRSPWYRGWGVSGPPPVSWPNGGGTYPPHAGFASPSPSRRSNGSRTGVPSTCSTPAAGRGCSQNRSPGVTPTGPSSPRTSTTTSSSGGGVAPSRPD